MVTVKELIKLFNLKPHPEGGYFKETYRANGTIKKQALPSNFFGDCSFSTAIYFLLPKGSKSSLHRIKSDEVWHFYLGGPLTLVIIHKSGQIENITMGQNVQDGQRMQYVVPAGSWFGVYPNSDTEFSFVGCTVAPGFDFNDFELGNKDVLFKQYPNAKEIIEKLSN